MSRAAGLFWATVVLAMFCGACSPDEEPVVKQASESDNGKTIELQTGQRLRLVLEANPSTGYTWELQPGDAALRLLGEPEYRADSEALGSGGEMSFLFAAEAPGDVALRLVYRRPFEKDKPPEKTFELTVKVKE